jgi:hypothetical protein
MRNQPTNRMPLTERRHCTRRDTDGIKVRLNVAGVCTRRCTVRCLSSGGIFIVPVPDLQPGLRVTSLVSQTMERPCCSPINTDGNDLLTAYEQNHPEACPNYCTLLARQSRIVAM